MEESTNMMNLKKAKTDNVDNTGPNQQNADKENSNYYFIYSEYEINLSPERRENVENIENIENINPNVEADKCNVCEQFPAPFRIPTTAPETTQGTTITSQTVGSEQEPHKAYRSPPFQVSETSLKKEHVEAEEEKMDIIPTEGRPACEENSLEEGVSDISMKQPDDQMRPSETNVPETKIMPKEQAEITQAKGKRGRGRGKKEKPAEEEEPVNRERSRTPPRSSRKKVSPDEYKKYAELTNKRTGRKKGN